MTRLLNSLFGKILLWFFLTIALSLAANALIFSLLGERRFDVTRNPHVFETFTTEMRLLLDTYDRDGLGGLREVLAFAPHLERTIRLYAQDGEDLLGNDAMGFGPPQSPSFVKRVGPYAFGHAPHKIIGTKTLSDGRTATIVFNMPGPPPPRDVLTSGPFWSNLGPVLIITSLLTYLLARVLTRPIRRLRNAARRIAGGDLHYRIGSDVGRGYEEINALSEDFDRMAANMELLVESQRRFLRDISHELRSPLTRLTVALELARQRTGDLAKSELDRIGLDAARLDELITQALTFVRMDHMHTYPDKTLLDFGVFLVRTVRDTDVESQAKGVHVILNPCESAMIEAVPELIRRGLENVLRNAIQHTPTGGTVQVSLVTEGEGEQGQAVLTVSDEGPGVPEEVLKEIFRLFYRVDNSISRDNVGTGIGLAIAKRAVELHHGTIAVSNNPDCGLCMEIRLPLAE